MFTKEELEIIFRVFEELVTDNERWILLKKKMSLLDEQRKIGDEANEKITKLQDEIQALYKTEKGGE